MDIALQTTIRANIETIRKKIEASARKVGRDPKEIHLIAVTKTYGIDYVREAVAAGISLIGENKVQEAKEKYTELEQSGNVPDFQLHLIGHLQTNKARQAVELFDMIHSVDSFRLAKEIDRRAYTVDKTMPILIQVNTSREATKYGVEPDNTLELIKQVSELKNIRIQGLMTIGALTAVQANDPEKIRSYFRRLRELRDFIREQNIPNVEMNALSMGMSSDFEIAIEEGANYIRIGTALFGKRKRAAKSAAPKSEETL
ncbi:MAG TPA: YggS family pyridoxal phosphate-dependent enzyme [bacterium]|nr:YggS family pyridoxal phosphate-dependent enzyme [bacterium]HMW36048.1 YggS family pyridoxal phosphate-dependent enzyme [bacterium]HMY36045.1 YggS family pyridoxal phosphate-dependent enzyme [bacterium]HMZ04778.1 YggS family pyridoxal phosphate-dependent enzyme [bacterium]HNB08321.1 YggS family pyridoxal phosphate-dependent enzyme [bacterium]